MVKTSLSVDGSLHKAEGYITVFLALICCLMAVVLIVFVELAVQVSDREVAQSVADEAALLGVEQLDEELFLTESKVSLDESAVTNIVRGLVQERSRDNDLRLSITDLEVSDTRVDLALFFVSDKAVDLESEFDNIVKASVEISVDLN